MMGLHHGLCELGMDSGVLTLASDAEDGAHTAQLSFPGAVTTRLAMKGDRIVRRVAGGRSAETFHTPIFPTAVPRHLRELRPDIVHLHWVGDLLTPRQIAQVARHRPTVWTLRDLAPLTGGCHYSHGCRRFEDRCRRCPLLGRPGRYDPTFWIHRAKLKAFDGQALTLVALSTWLAGEARRSHLFNGCPTHVIPPGIDTETFWPRDRSRSRSAFALDDARPVVGFVALDPLGEKRKGAHLLDQALQLLGDEGRTLTAVVTATEEYLADHAPLQASSWVPVGPITDGVRLAALYSACDVVVVPSTQEAFGKVAAEALACGVPVVAFAGTGVSDAVDSTVAGYLASPGSAADLAIGITWALGKARDGRTRRKRHELVAQRFGVRAQAQRYAEIYRSVSGKGPRCQRT